MLLSQSIIQNKIKLHEIYIVLLNENMLKNQFGIDRDALQLYEISNQLHFLEESIKKLADVQKIE